MTTTTAAPQRELQRLQRTVIDGLEKVKAVDIVVFDTTHLSSLFERVIVASGGSNRQTKALASAVREAMRKDGYAPPRVEGEDNGEWIIVDCGRVVVHIMQPSFRQYYGLEALWGGKAVRVRLAAKPRPATASGAAKPSAPAAATKTMPRRAKASSAVPAAKRPARAKRSS